MYTQSVSSSC